MIAEEYSERMKIPMVYWLQCEKKWDFPTKIDGSLLIYLPSQSVDCVGWASYIQWLKSRKNQVEWHKSSDSYNHQWKNYRQVGNFGDSAIWWTIKQVESNWRSCRYLQAVSIHKFKIYKTVSRPRVNKSLERNFIKVILTKNQGRGKENKEWMCWVKSDSLLHREVQCSP